MEVFNHAFDAAAQPGQAGNGPTCANVEHVDMPASRSGNKVGEALPVVPRAHAIQESQGHGCAFKGKTAVLDCNVIKPRGQLLMITWAVVRKRRMIAIEKDPANILQLFTN